MRNKTFNHFAGKVIQAVEGLDYGDAVSSQVVSIAQLLKENFGFDSRIYAAHFHPLMESYGERLKEIQVDEKDIIFFHFSGFAPQLEEAMTCLKCSKVLVYHNITPEYYFNETMPEYLLCKKGREQLRNIISLSKCHFYIGDSQYNLDELISLGVDASRTAVLPIIIEGISGGISGEKDCSQDDINWLFVGRIVPNKRQDILLNYFYEYIHAYGGEHKLFLVGNYAPESEYYQSLCEWIRVHNLEDKVILTGKIPEDDLINYYSHADIFVCVSEHEGFGVPLIEAMHYQLPVIAVGNAAIAEVLEGSEGLVSGHHEIVSKVHQVLTDQDFKERLMLAQHQIMARYTAERLVPRMHNILQQLIPRSDEYKTVSVVICTYNRGNLLDRCLDYLQYQTCSEFEVIVVNGPSDDNTEEVIEKYKDKIKIGRTNQRNLSVSRNIGIELSSGDIVAFIDDDALFYDNFVEKILALYNRIPYYVGGVGLPVVYAGSFDYQFRDRVINLNAESNENVKEKIKDPAWFRYVNSSFKRKALFDINGFDEQYDYFLDETDVSLRLQLEHQYLLYYDPEIYIRHDYAESNNRKGKYKFNWRTIVKNTVYFILKFNMKKSFSEKFKVIIRTVYHNRLKYFWEAWKAKEITFKEMLNYSVAVIQGALKGIKDAKPPRKLRQLASASMGFFPYEIKQYCLEKKLHVVLVTQEFLRFTEGNGGIATMYYHLASELLQMGHRVSVIVMGESENTNHCGEFSLYQMKLKKYFSQGLDAPVFVKNMEWSLTAAEKLLDIHREYPVSIVESALWNIEGYALAFLKTKIPFIVRLVTPLKVVKRIEQFQMDHLDEELSVFAEKKLIARADGVISISQNIAKTIQKEYGFSENTNWHIQPIGIAYWPQFESAFNYGSITGVDPEGRLESLPPDATKILFLGRLEKRKGIDLFLEAALRLLEREKDLYFIIGGRDTGGWKEKYEKHQRIIFLGNIPLNFKDKLYVFSDIVVFPSRYESFGLVPLEAFVHGKPVIASRSGGIPEVVEDNVSGILFEENNVESLVKAILKIKNNKNLYQQLSEGALARVKTLSSRNMAIASVKLYTEILKKGPQ